MVGGRGVRLADESAVLEGDLFLCLDVDGAGSEAWVRRASLVERGWLPENGLREATEVAFDPVGQRVTARRRRYWEDLLLEETTAAIPNTEDAAQLLAQAAREHWDRVFPHDDASVAGFVARARWLREQLPEADLPALDEATLQESAPGAVPRTPVVCRVAWPRRGWRPCAACTASINCRPSTAKRRNG